MDLNEYLPLYKAILQGNCEAAEEILENDPDASKARINSSKQTALHIAVATCKPYCFVEKLVKLMLDDESISLKDDSGNTALSIAAVVGNKEAAVLLVDKMNSLLYDPDSFGNFPVHQAAQFPNKDMLEYLIAQTRDDLEINPYAGTNGLRLLTYVIDAEYFDVAIYLVQKYPHVATLKLPDGTSALKKIAAKRSFFLNTNDFTFWKRCMLNDKSFLIQQAVELVKCLCKIMGSMSHEDAADINSDAILMATELGSHEVVEQILEIFPDAIHCSIPSSKQSIFHIAVLNRSTDVFNLIYQKQKSEYKHFHLNTIDSDGNNLLHTAAKLAPSRKLNEVSSEALQMQREIRWYKEMQCIVNPNCKHQQNKAGKTPKEVFAEEHMKLKEKAEEWTKETANSSMVVAALIAGSITVPGGQDSNSGFPIFVNRTAFFVYMTSNGFAFIMATICILMLLFMLIFRNSTEDFLVNISNRLMFSLATLFLSVAGMIVSFLACIFLQDRTKDSPHRVAARELMLTCLPPSFGVVLLQVYLRKHLITTYDHIKSVRRNRVCSTNKYF